jgi:hypothetical protein
MGLQLNVNKMSDLVRLTVQLILKIRTKQGMRSDSSYFRDFKIEHSVLVFVNLISVLKYI